MNVAGNRTTEEVVAGWRGLDRGSGGGSSDFLFPSHCDSLATANVFILMIRKKEVVIITTCPHRVDATIFAWFGVVIATISMTEVMSIRPDYTLD
jgi:hypothetical protein